MFQRLIILVAIISVLCGSTAIAGHRVYVAVVPGYVAPPVAYAPAPYVAAYPPYAVPVAPPAYYVVPGRNIYGGPRLYVPGEPIRNTWRAVTP